MVFDTHFLQVVLNPAWNPVRKQKVGALAPDVSATVTKDLNFTRNQT